MKILITPRPFQTKGLNKIEKLRKGGYEVEYNNLDHRFTIEELINRIEDADAIITGNDLLNKEILGKAHKLKVISKYGVGLDNIDLEYANSRGIKVCKALEANSISVAEMAIQLMLASSRSFYKLCDNSKKLIDKRIMGTELFRKRLGIFGLGSIGKYVAKIAHSFGMEIVAYDPYINKDTLREYIDLVPFDEIVKTADYISLHLPLEDSTRYMFNDNVFSKMKSTAIIINTARAGLIDCDSLYKALTNGNIAFAAEDVELKERTKKIIELDNYIILPHAASFTKEADENTINITVKNVLEVLENSLKEGI